MIMITIMRIMMVGDEDGDDHDDDDDGGDGDFHCHCYGVDGHGGDENTARVAMKTITTAERASEGR